MDIRKQLTWICLALFFGAIVAEPEFCNRGFQIAAKYHNCWGDANYKRPYQGFEGATILTPEKLQEYATHMCSIVKPIAMECLRSETTSCKNQEKLLQIADESGGACLHSHLSPDFKKYVIDYLKPIRRNSPCFQISQTSYACYVKAGEKVLASGESHVDISQFHRVADKFFGSIWDCTIEVFKQAQDTCEDWQIPMLLSLQKTAMPSLFGMHLSFDQIAKLELTPKGQGLVSTSRPETTVSPNSSECSGEGEKETNTYLLIRVIRDKKEASPGDIVIELTSKKEERDLSMVSGPSFDEDVHDLVEQLLDENGLLDMQKVRRKMREDRKKQREINDYLERIKAAEKKRLKEKKKKLRDQQSKGGKAVRARARSKKN